MRVLLLLVVVAVIGVPEPAWGCSYLPRTIEEALEGLGDGEAVAIVRRIDGGGVDGGVEVVEVVTGQLPEEFDVTFVNGGSCYPSFGPGEVAGLVVSTGADGPVVEVDAQLDQRSVLQRLEGPLTFDPDAAGPPALLLAGRMPGADLMVLDAAMRVSAMAEDADGVHHVLVCGSTAVVLRLVAGGLVLEARAVEDLTVPSTVAMEEYSARQAIGCDGEVGMAIDNGSQVENVAEGRTLLFDDGDGLVTVDLDSGELLGRLDGGAVSRQGWTAGGPVVASAPLSTTAADHVVTVGSPPAPVGSSPPGPPDEEPMRGPAPSPTTVDGGIVVRQVTPGGVAVVGATAGLAAGMLGAVALVAS